MDGIPRNRRRRSEVHWIGPENLDRAGLRATGLRNLVQTEKEEELLDVL